MTPSDVACWKFCKERNIYSGDNNQNRAVIDAEISVKRAEYLSLEEHGILMLHGHPTASISPE